MYHNCTASHCSADADFSCFADLAVTSPVDYYKEGEGSLMQCVLTPADPYMPLDNDSIAAKVDQQVRLPPTVSMIPSHRAGASFQVSDLALMPLHARGFSL